MTTHAHTIASRTAREVGGWQEPSLTPQQKLQSVAMQWILLSRCASWLNQVAIKRQERRMKQMYHLAYTRPLQPGQRALWEYTTADDRSTLQTKWVVVERQIGNKVLVRIYRSLTEYDHRVLVRSALRG